MFTGEDLSECLEIIENLFKYGSSFNDNDKNYYINKTLKGKIKLPVYYEGLEEVIQKQLNLWRVKQRKSKATYAKFLSEFISFHSLNDIFAYKLNKNEHSHNWFYEHSSNQKEEWFYLLLNKIDYKNISQNHKTYERYDEFLEILTFYSKKLKDQTTTWINLFTTIATLEYMFLLHSNYESDAMFQNFIKVKFSHKTGEELLEQAFTQIYCFYHSYKMFKEEYECDYEVPEDIGMDIILFEMKKWYNSVNDHSYRTLITCLYNILNNESVEETLKQLKLNLLNEKETKIKGLENLETINSIVAFSEEVTFIFESNLRLKRLNEKINEKMFPRKSNDTNNNEIITANTVSPNETIFNNLTETTVPATENTISNMLIERSQKLNENLFLLKKEFTKYLAELWKEKDEIDYHYKSLPEIEQLENCENIKNLKIDNERVFNIYREVFEILKCKLGEVNEI
jgi:hypothetical protein